MLFRVHVLFGIFCWLVLDAVLFMPFWVLFWVLLGSVLVDVDSASSKLGRRFKFLSWFFAHRGFLHSLLACVLVSAVFGLLNLWFGFGVFVGWMSHLIMDSLTVQGVGIFWPLGFRLRGFIRSGGWMEDVCFVVLLGLDIVFGVYKFL
jgi:inner membrane protein